MLFESCLIIAECKRGATLLSPAFTLAGQKKYPSGRTLTGNKIPGVDLLSHTVTRAVPSALKGLTTVFGMGTGGTLSLTRPEKNRCPPPTCRG